MWIGIVYLITEELILVLETHSWQVFNGPLVLGYTVWIQLCVVHCQLNSVSQACHAKMAGGGTRLQREFI